MGVMLPTLRRGPAQDLFAGAADLADERPRAAGAGRGGRRRGRADRLRRRGRQPRRSNRRSAAWPSCSGRSTGRRAGSRSASIMRCAGKDLIDSVTQSGKIARILGGRPPEGFNYEMFLDEKGEKISKSKGNGLSLEEWLRYGSEESLAFYIYREPKSAKSLHLGVIPRAVDEYWQFRGNYPGQPIEQKLGNPVHHIHARQGARAATLPLTYGLLLNLVSLPGRRRQGHRVEVRPALCAGHVARDRPRARRADRPRGQLRPRFRRADAASAARRREWRPQRCATSTPSSRSCPPDADGRGHPDAGVRSRQAPPVRKPARLVPGALRNPARLQPRPAHGQLHRALRHRQQPPPDRRGAGCCWPSVGFRPIADTRSISCEFAATPVGGASLGHYGPGTTQLSRKVFQLGQPVLHRQHRFRIVDVDRRAEIRDRAGWPRRRQPDPGAGDRSSGGRRISGSICDGLVPSWRTLPPVSAPLVTATLSAVHRLKALTGDADQARHEEQWQ